MRGDAEGTATIEIETSGVVRAKDLVRMRMPIWYDAMQASPEAAARVARECGARPVVGSCRFAKRSRTAWTEAEMTPQLPKPGTHAARILDELKKHPHGASDGQLARLLVIRHEIVNSNCRLMEAQGLISREKRNGPILNKMLVQHPTATETTAFDEGIQDAVPPGNTTPGANTIVDGVSMRERINPAATPASERPWSWEGNVQAVVADYLSQQGWTVHRTADTAAREPGKDIEAKREGTVLWVTVKGFPLAQPHTQARLWFADAILDVVRYRQEDAAVLIAIALPDSHLYQRWQERTAWFQRVAPFDYLWVGEDGTVRYDPGRPSIL